MKAEYSEKKKVKIKRIEAIKKKLLNYQKSLKRLWKSFCKNLRNAKKPGK